MNHLISRAHNCYGSRGDYTISILDLSQRSKRVEKFKFSSKIIVDDSIRFSEFFHCEFSYAPTLAYGSLPSSHLLITINWIKLMKAICHNYIVCPIFTQTHFVACVVDFVVMTCDNVNVFNFFFSLHLCVLMNREQKRNDMPKGQEIEHKQIRIHTYLPMERRHNWLITKYEVIPEFYYT